jgi:hypothetical protein
MTLPAVETWNLRGLRGPDYKVGPFCSNPDCHRFAEHAHHIVRRSAIGGDYAWVEIDGVVYANKTGVCPECHDELTGRVGGHRAAIRLEQGLFVWCKVVLRPNGEVIEYVPVGELKPQPPTWEIAVDGLELASSVCPTCGHERRPSGPKHPQRHRKSWIVKVPADQEENGAEVLDSLVSNLVPLIPNSDASAAGRYYVLVPVLAYSLMDSGRFVQTMAGVGG